MSCKRARINNETQDEYQPPTKRQKIITQQIPIISKLFADDYEQQHYQILYKTIYESNVVQTQHVPAEIVKNIAEFGSRFHVKCDNFKYCHNKILPWNDGTQLIKEQLFKHDWNQIYEDYGDADGEGQIAVLNREGMKCVEQFGYFYVEGLSTSIFTDKEYKQYYCADCITQTNGKSFGLEWCSSCYDVLTIFNNIPDCDCGHYFCYCPGCDADPSRYCNICEVPKCHESDGCREEDKYDCHQEFECYQCETYLCSKGVSADDVGKRCKECIDYICAECQIQVHCDGCDRIKCWTHETCWKYEETNQTIKFAFTKCDNPICNYNNMKNGPLYKMWFGSK